jgi:hypothetical protein
MKPVAAPTAAPFAAAGNGRDSVQPSSFLFDIRVGLGSVLNTVLLLIGMAMLHAARAPSISRLPSLAASSGVFPILARDDVGGIPTRPVVLGSGWFVLAMMFLCLLQHLRQCRNVKIAEPSLKILSASRTSSLRATVLVEAN